MNLKDFDFRVLVDGVLMNNLKYEEIQSNNFFSSKKRIGIELYMGFKDCNGVKIFDGDILLNKHTNKKLAIEYKKGTFYVGLEPLHNFLLSLENFNGFNGANNENLPNFEIIDNIHN